MEILPGNKASRDNFRDIVPGWMLGVWRAQQREEGREGVFRGCHVLGNINL